MKWLVPYQDTTWTFDDERITASEARLQKRITDGLLPAQADGARAQMDPDAWVAALVIARRRSGMSADDALKIDADDLDLMACMNATSGADDEAEPAEPEAVTS